MCKYLLSHLLPLTREAHTFVTYWRGLCGIITVTARGSVGFPTGREFRILCPRADAKTTAIVLV